MNIGKRECTKLKTYCKIACNIHESAISSAIGRATVTGIMDKHALTPVRDKAICSNELDRLCDYLWARDHGRKTRRGENSVHIFNPCGGAPFGSQALYDKIVFFSRYEKGYRWSVESYRVTVRGVVFICKKTTIVVTDRVYVLTKNKIKEVL